MADQQAIVAGIQTKLTAVQTAGTVYAAVSGRIYNGPPSLDEALPFVSHFVVTDPVRRSFNKAGSEMEIQVDIYDNLASGAASCRAIADKVFALLDNAAVTATGWSGVQAQCIERGGAEKEEDAFRITQRYRIWATEA